MSQDSKNFAFNIFCSSITISMTKSPNILNQIVNFDYKGTDCSSIKNCDKTMSYNIQFGNVFNFESLISPYILTSEKIINSQTSYYSRFAENE